MLIPRMMEYWMPKYNKIKRINFAKKDRDLMFVKILHREGMIFI
jgi:hypothetical protein